MSELSEQFVVIDKFRREAPTLFLADFWGRVLNELERIMGEEVALLANQNTKDEQ